MTTSEVRKNRVGTKLSALATALLVAGSLSLATAAPAAAQTGAITGTITNAQTGTPLAAAQVSIEGTGLGTLSLANGKFLILRVPVGTYTVNAVLIGYAPASVQVTVGSGESAVADMRMESQAVTLSEIIVTGVAGATVKAKLPFDVAQVNVRDLPVPATDMGTALQGKVAGATVFSGSGRPGSAPSILLRGATSIDASGRSQDPLYIVDGVILSSSMVDIDAPDIESIEVVKGAAAASLYGSRAANGVVQITTKRGATVSDDNVRYTVRTDIGTNKLPPAQVTTLKHPYLMNAAGTAFIDGRDGSECQWLTCKGRPPLAGQAANGAKATEWNSYTNQAWPGQTYNNVDRFFDGGSHVENYVSAMGRSGRTNFLVSFSSLNQGGIMRGVGGFDRQNFRVNLDQSVNEKFTLSASALYSRSVQAEVSDNGGGSPLFALTRQPAGVDLLQCQNDPTKSCANDPQNLLLIPDPFNASESANPVYQMMVEKYDQHRDRFLGSTTATWSPLSWLTVDGNASWDRLGSTTNQHYPKGYRTVGSNTTLNNGYLYEANSRNESFNGSVTATGSFTLADGINNKSQLRYLYEQDDSWSSNMDANTFSVVDLYTFNNVDPTTYSGGSSSSSTRSDGYFFISSFEVKDKYFVDGLIRNDGSSLFGKDNRRAWYYRIAGAWRLGTEPWFKIGLFDELKLRAAYGTAGNRPRFVAQYETYSVSGGVISPVTLGNKNLRPEQSGELEVGMDASMHGGMFGLGLTYATTTTTDQILSVPLPAFSGFRTQYQNAGTLESKTWEATFDARVLRTADASLSARLIFDRTRSKITKLGVAPYTYGVGGQGLGTVFYAREGEQMGQYYGTQVAQTCDQLPTGVDCSLFEVNDDGYLVYTGGNGFANPQWGTKYNLPAGSAIYNGETSVYWGTPFGSWCTDRVSGERTVYCPVGKATPDYHVGMSSTFQYKGFQVYGMLDAEQGFDVYNQTAQWATFRSNSAMMETGPDIANSKPQGYYNHWYVASGRLSPNTIFVEDGSYVKLRELSARYTVSKDQLGAVPGLNRFGGVTLSVTGRNLHTWTNYRGYDPEVGKGGGSTGSSALARVDGYTYPNFRTFSFGMEVIF